MATHNGRLPALLPLVIIGVLVGPCVFIPARASQMNQTKHQGDQEFGPVVRAYLGYLNNEQEVVDDRVSRREVSASYYRHNSNRIKALRQMAIRLARESHNDYLPELEAVSAGEMSLLFGPQPPAPARLKVGEILRNTFRYLGPVRVASEVFYLFARLDPYEQAELNEKAVSSKAETARPEKNQR
ncbi:MAG: hypothetical protein LC794_19140 [Acidobacteria bacterium]|nr:hypothetical protein [Acidobacteriota bacterium]